MNEYEVTGRDSERRCIEENGANIFVDLPYGWQ